MADKCPELNVRRTQRGQATKLLKQGNDAVVKKDTVQGNKVLLNLRRKFTQLEVLDNSIIYSGTVTDEKLDDFVVECVDYLNVLNDKIHDLEISVTSFAPVQPPATVGQSRTANPAPRQDWKKLSLPKLHLPKFSGEILGPISIVCS